MTLGARVSKKRHARACVRGWRRNTVDAICVGGGDRRVHASHDSKRVNRRKQSDSRRVRSDVTSDVTSDVKSVVERRGGRCGRCEADTELLLHRFVVCDTGQQQSARLIDGRPFSHCYRLVLR